MRYWEESTLSEDAKSALRVALNLTFHAQADPEHLLIAMLDDAESPLVGAVRSLKPGLAPLSIVETITIAIRSSKGGAAVDSWSDAMLSSRFREMCEAMQDDPDWAQADGTSCDRLLAAAALKASRPRNRVIFDRFGVPAAALEHKLRDLSDSDQPPPIFDDAGHVNREACDGGVRDVLRLIETEGRGLGLSRIGSPLLLFAFASREDGLLARGLRLQLVDPKSVHEALMQHLRKLGSGRFCEELALDRSAMQEVVVRTFERAADSAVELGLPLVGEAELVNAFIKQGDLFVTSFLQSSKVDLGQLSKFLGHRHSGEPELVEVSEEPRLPTISEVERHFRDRVIGQDHVIDALMPMIKRLRFGYFRPGKPAGVLLFLGMSGTGKTQLAKEIAHVVYGSEEQLIYLEMGQFGDKYSKTIFVGAPPGYIGYGEGLLTNGLRNKPESVVLFDEVEKAHKSVFDVVLRFLDEGQIADPAGPVRDGRKCIIVLTSNHALDQLDDLIREQTALKNPSPQRRDEVRARVRDTILKTEFFRPEFLNRVDEILLFNSFTEEAYGRIVRNRLERERQTLRREKDLEISFDPSLADLLVKKSVARSNEGARVCERLVSNLVVAPLIDFFVAEENAGVRSVLLRVGPSETIEVVAAKEGQP